MKRYKGTSLLEIIVVIAIFSILLFLSATTIINWIDKSKVKTSAEELFSNIQWARSLALKYGSSCVRFASQSYRIYAPDCCSSSCSAVTPKRVIFLPGNISFSSAPNYIVFGINSLPQNISNLVQIKISGFSKIFTITINANGGISFE